MYVPVFNRQHVEATQVSIFSLFSECNDSFKTFSNVGFPGNACTPWTSASCKYYYILCIVDKMLHSTFANLLTSEKSS